MSTNLRIKSYKKIHNPLSNIVLSIFLSTALLSNVNISAAPHDDVMAEWDRLIQKSSFEAEYQSFCYSNSSGEVVGKNIDIPVRLASVTKLLTSLWSVEKLKSDYRFLTKFYIKDKHLHIEGSFDPFVGTEKLFFIISELNKQGYFHFDKITFDKNFIVFPNAQSHVNEYPILNQTIIQSTLKTYFNTSKWSGIFEDEYSRIAKMTKAFQKETIMLEKVDFNTHEIVPVSSNPFIVEDLDEHGIPVKKLEDGVRKLTLTSPKLKEYLKEINIKSNNYASHTLFRFLGGAKEMTSFLKTKYSLNENKIYLYSGSGLPVTINGERKDNYATCSVLIGLLKELNSALLNQNESMQSIVAVPGSDQGTFRNRLNDSSVKNTFMAKTGTLNHSSTLAGAMSTKKLFTYFGIFNHTSNILKAKEIQNTLVKKMLQSYGGGSVFDYTPESFFSVDKKIQLKGFRQKPQPLFLGVEGGIQ